MDKSLYLLEIEIEQLKQRLEIFPEDVLCDSEHLLTRSKQIHYPEGAIQCLLIMSRCALQIGWHNRSLHYSKEALDIQNSLDNDTYLPEILHLHAMNFWESGKYYTAQQYWINALEQSTLEEQIEILIASLLGLGNIWRSTNEHALACDTHQLAVKVANTTRIAWLEGRARILWARDLYLLENHAEMLTVLDVAMELLESHHNKQWLAEAWNFQALALLGLERLDEAENAIFNALHLAQKHHITWIQSHAYLNRSRLEFMRQDIEKATTLLVQAEQFVGGQDDKHDLLIPIYYQQSVIAEQKKEYELALRAFKKYRNCSVSHLKAQITQESKDKAQSQKRQLNQRAKKQINRIRSQYEYDPEKHLSNVVSETHWWEQLILFKTALTHSNHSVIIIYHELPEYIDICTELAHSLCSKQDLVARLSSERLGLLLSDKDDIAQNIFDIIQKMIEIYPWERKGLRHSPPQVTLHDILSFPFTLDQLIQLPNEGQHAGLIE